MVMISVNKSYNKVRYPLKHRFTLVNDFSLGSLARDKHLIQAFPLVFTLQCLTGKAN